jgi:outer membrane biogenesis lipoprotein LolB
MKKFGLIILVVCSVSAVNVSIFAQEYEFDNQSAYMQARWGSGLESEINHLNRMLGHVRWELARYRANWQVRRDFESIRHQVDRVNWKYRHGDYNRRELRREVERLHADLHNLEVQLRARNWDYYRWR